MYPQHSISDWQSGKTGAVGLKARIGHFQADAHQREQEKVVRNELLDRVKVVKHKPFYAGEIYLDHVHLRAISATFDDADKRLTQSDTASEAFSETLSGMRVSEMVDAEASWFAYDDYVDTTSRPDNADPVMEMYDIATCPRVQFSKWVSARRMTNDIRKEVQAGDGTTSSLEASKFGHERTHDCLMKSSKRKCLRQRQSHTIDLIVRILQLPVKPYRNSRLAGSTNSGSKWKSLLVRNSAT